MGRDIEIRLRLNVNNDHYLSNLESYLRNEETLDGRNQMVIEALKVFWYPLALHSQGANLETIERAIIESNYLWQAHLFLMLGKTGARQQLVAPFLFSSVANARCEIGEKENDSIVKNFNNSQIEEDCKISDDNPIFKYFDN